MHELALTEGILDIISSEAKKQNFRKVEEIRLMVGEYSGVIPECIQEFFPIASKGTAAEGAELVFELVPAQFQCLECGYLGKLRKQGYCCMECGSTATKMIKGREFYVDSLKVE